MPVCGICDRAVDQQIVSLNLISLCHNFLANDDIHITATSRIFVPKPTLDLQQQQQQEYTKHHCDHNNNLILIEWFFECLYTRTNIHGNIIASYSREKKTCIQNTGDEQSKRKKK